MTSLVPVEAIQARIFLIRGLKVILDWDLAKLYGTTTKRLKQQIKRNKKRFPEGFLFQLTNDEKGEVVSMCAHLKPLKFSPVLPHAFTEHGALMAATVLNTDLAIKTSVFIMKAFVELRERAETHKDLMRKLNQLEFVVGLHDEKNRSLFKSIRKLVRNPRKQVEVTGFK